MQIYLRKAVEDGQVIFPKKFVLTSAEKGDRKVESIEQLKADLIPSEFAALYLNDPVDSDAIEFKPSWFQVYDPQQHDLSNAVTLLSLDPAFRLKQTNDFSGITISKVTADSKVYILEAQQKKLNANDLINHIFNLVGIYKPDKVIVETVAAQIVLLEMIRERMAKENKWFVVEEVKLDTSETKAMRIRAMINFYANMRVYHAPGLKELEAQLTEFPRGLHDDIIDSLAHMVKFWKAPHLVTQQAGTKPGTFGWWKKLAQDNKFKDKLFTDFRR